MNGVKQRRLPGLVRTKDYVETLLEIHAVVDEASEGPDMKFCQDHLKSQAATLNS